MTTRDPHPIAEPTDSAQTASGERYGWRLTVLLFEDACSFISRYIKLTLVIFVSFLILFYHGTATKDMVIVRTSIQSGRQDFALTCCIKIVKIIDAVFCIMI